MEETVTLDEFKIGRTLSIGSTINLELDVIVMFRT